MSVPPRPADRLSVPTDGGVKAWKRIPRPAFLLVMCLLALGIVITVPSLLPLLDDDTKLRVVQVFLADLNGDDYQDAFLVTNQMHGLVFNDGAGSFTLDRGLLMYNYAFALGDTDGDGGLEAVLVSFGEGEMKLECADLPPDYVFPTRPPGAPNQVFAIRDGNGDGIPEDFVAGCCNRGTIMANRATLFLDKRPCLGSESANAIALADLNGDRALDGFVSKGGTPAKRDTPNEVWINDGQGNLADSGQQLGDSESYAAAVGDLNGDGVPDIVAGKRRGGEIWFGDGQGQFTKGRQRLGSGTTYTVFVSDLNGDGSLDLFLGGYTSIQAWLNDGAGRFKPGQRLRYDRREAVALGDVTGDGVADIFVAGPDSYQVWRGTGDGHFSADARSAYR